MDAVEIVERPAANEGFVTRRANIVRSRVVDLMGDLHVDLFLQDKFLINGVDVKVRLVRSKSAFVLMAGGNREGHPESDHADGAHQGSREEHGQVSDANRRMQGVLHSRRRSVAHAREPVPRHSAVTFGAVLHR